MNWFDKYIAKNNSVFIIAEAGINHNGNFDLAIELIDEAKNAGADCVKFQTFSYSASESKHSTMPSYFEGRVGFNTKKEWYDSITFSTKEFFKLKVHCDKIGIVFLSTACDVDGLKILKEIRAEALKIASADVDNDYLLQAVAKTGLPVILSTGMATMNDIAHGFETLRKNGANEIAITQCTSQYPAPIEDVNLKVMEALAERFNVPVGISDHTLGSEIAVAATAMGAKIIEKHFTLSRNLSGVDHAASIEPIELKELVYSIRKVEKALGNSRKTVASSEKENALNMKRSLMAARPIKAGSIILEEDVTAKRPGTGISPSRLKWLLGKVIMCDMEYEDMFDEKLLEDSY